MDESATQHQWERWLGDNAAKFLLFARQQARVAADAQDLVQEAVVEAAKRQDNGQPPPVGLVYATIHRRAIDWARGQDRRVAREQATLGAEPDSWFDTSVEDRERGQAIQSAMKQLPEMYRQVITLKIWSGLTFAQIAEVLSVPANTVASRYRYGLAELRKLTKEVVT